MIHENQEYKYPTNNILSVLVGTLIGSLAGAVTMLLLAPQSGKDTRTQIQKKGIELRDRTTLCWWHGAGTPLPFCNADLCPDRMGCGKNNLGAFLPTA